MGINRYVKSSYSDVSGIIAYRLLRDAGRETRLTRLSSATLSVIYDTASHHAGHNLRALRLQTKTKNKTKQKTNKNMARVHRTKLIAVLCLCTVVMMTVITVLQNRSIILPRYKSANIKDADNAKQRQVERQTSTPEDRHRTRNVSAFRREGPIWPRTAQTRPLTCQNCFHFDFPILLENSSICRTGSGFESVDVIMMIFTTHRETLRREAIRKTWASVTRQNTANTRHFFILGRSNSTKQMLKTEDEHARHGDLLMLDFVDSYANLTFKTMSGLRWIINRCGQAR